MSTWPILGVSAEQRSGEGNAAPAEAPKIVVASRRGQPGAFPPKTPV